METGCCVLPAHLLGERGPWPTFLAAVGWEVKLPKALLWFVSFWPKISCPQAAFIRLDLLKGYHVLGSPVHRLPAEPFQTLLLPLLGSFPSHPHPHPNNRIHMVAMGTEIGCFFRFLWQTPGELLAGFFNSRQEVAQVVKGG